jgi:outer membrane protein assembly factor BamD
MKTLKSGFSFGRSGLVGLLCLAALAGCERPADTSVSIEDLTPEQLYILAERRLETERNPTDAARLFGEIERLHPYSDWARRALVMQAYAHHSARDYEAARASAQRYLDVFPGEEDAAYAQYLVALSYYDQVDQIGRDQGLTFQALQALRAVIEGYPDSKYARSAMLKFDLAYDHLAAKEMEIGRYYLRKGHYAAAVNRFRAVVETYQTTTHTPESLHRLVEAYLALGLPAEAQTAGAILGHNFAANPFYADSYKLLTDQGLTPEDGGGDGWLSQLYRQVLKGEWL